MSEESTSSTDCLDATLDFAVSEAAVFGSGIEPSVGFTRSEPIHGASTNQLIRIGAVSYLNSKPLIEDLNRLATDAELSLDYPSRLADDLADGQLDVALVPSIECFRGGYEIACDACVATRGPVLSVKLYSRVSIGAIRSLALDEGSRTSAALVQIMLSERFGVEPTLLPLPLGMSTSESPADAVLLIGDRAIHPPEGRFIETWDLGEQWTEWTGLPFVFAMWAVRPDVELGCVSRALAEARDRGVQRLERIAAREAAALGISERTAADYLKQNLHFTLGPAERSGLSMFHRMAVNMGLVSKGSRIVYRDRDRAVAE